MIVVQERPRRSVADLMEELDFLYPGPSVSISVMTIVELTHGIHRSTEPRIAQRRQEFLDRLAALQRNDAILTLNKRHFALIPDLHVLTPS
jgi:predicted nucleic acid-binding protein